MRAKTGCKSSGQSRLTIRQRARRGPRIIESGIIALSSLLFFFFLFFIFLLQGSVPVSRYARATPIFQPLPLPSSLLSPPRCEIYSHWQLCPLAHRTNLSRALLLLLPRRGWIRRFRGPRPPLEPSRIPRTSTLAYLCRFRSFSFLFGSIERDCCDPFVAWIYWN